MLKDLHTVDILTSKQDMSNLEKIKVRSYPPPRKVFAIRDFPPLCGRKTPLLSNEELTETLASQSNKSLSKEKSEDEDKPFDKIKARSYPPPRKVWAKRDFPPFCGRNLGKEELMKILASQKNKSLGQPNPGDEDNPLEKAIRTDVEQVKELELVQDIDALVGRLEADVTRLPGDKIQYQTEELFAEEVRKGARRAAFEEGSAVRDFWPICERSLSKEEFMKTLASQKNKSLCQLRSGDEDNTLENTIRADVKQAKEPELVQDVDALEGRLEGNATRLPGDKFQYETENLVTEEVREEGALRGAAEKEGKVEVGDIREETSDPACGIYQSENDIEPKLSVINTSNEGGGLEENLRTDAVSHAKGSSLERIHFHLSSSEDQLPGKPSETPETASNWLTVHGHLDSSNSTLRKRKGECEADVAGSSFERKEMQNDVILLERAKSVQEMVNNEAEKPGGTCVNKKSVVSGGRKRNKNDLVLSVQPISKSEVDKSDMAGSSFERKEKENDFILLERAKSVQEMVNNEAEKRGGTCVNKKSVVSVGRKRKKNDLVLSVQPISKSEVDKSDVAGSSFERKETDFMLLELAKSVQEMVNNEAEKRGGTCVNKKSVVSGGRKRKKNDSVLSVQPISKIEADKSDMAGSSFERNEKENDFILLERAKSVQEMVSKEAEMPGGTYVNQKSVVSGGRKRKKNDLVFSVQPISILEISEVDNEGTARKQVKETLHLFHTLCRKLLEQKSNSERGSSSRRVDNQAAKILKDEGKYVNTGKQIIGHVPGVEIGDQFQFMVELNIIGLHRQTQSGIDYVKQDGRIIATSIVASGGYDDDLNNPDVLTYTGQGGNVMQRNKEPEDQKLERGNLALVNSIDAGNPVRVIRGMVGSSCSSDAKSKTYFYDGLYLVEKYDKERGPHGKLVFKFKLVRIPGQPSLLKVSTEEFRTKNVLY